MLVVTNSYSLTRFSSGETGTEQNTRNGPIWSIIGQYTSGLPSPRVESSIDLQ
jgi:hypothetical protein